MKKWMAFAIMGVGLCIAVFTSNMSILQRILALGVLAGFGVFLWKKGNLKEVVKETKEEFQHDMEHIKKEVKEEIEDLKEEIDKV